MSPMVTHGVMFAKRSMEVKACVEMSLKDMAESLLRCRQEHIRTIRCFSGVLHKVSMHVAQAHRRPPDFCVCPPTPRERERERAVFPGTSSEVPTALRERKKEGEEERHFGLLKKNKSEGSMRSHCSPALSLVRVHGDIFDYGLSK